VPLFLRFPQKRVRLPLVAAQPQTHRSPVAGGYGAATGLRKHLQGASVGVSHYNVSHFLRLSFRGGCALVGSDASACVRHGPVGHGPCPVSLNAGFDGFDDKFRREGGVAAALGDSGADNSCVLVEGFHV